MDFSNIKNLFFENIGHKQTIIKNSFWLAFAQFFSKGVYFFVFIWLARHFGPQIYGQWSFALSFVSFFAVFVDFGFTILVIKELARDKGKSSKYVSNILTMKLLLSLIIAGLAITLIRFLSKDQVVVDLVYFLSLYIIIDNFGSLLQAIFRANEKMEYEAFCKAAQSLVLLGLSAFFILANSSILTISFVFFAASFMGVVFSLFFLRRYFFKPSFGTDIKTWKEIIKQVWPFLLSGIFYMLYFEMGSIMLGILSSMKEVGYYNAAYNLFIAIFIIPDIIAVSFFPKLSYFYEKDRAEMRKIFSHFRASMIIVGLFLSAAMYLLSDFIIVRIYSPDYAVSSYLLKILSSIVLFKFLSYIYNWFLLSSDEQKKVLTVTGSAALLNLILNYFLIIKYSAMGAAIATVITELFLLIFCYIFFRMKWHKIYSADKR